MAYAFSGQAKALLSLRRTAHRPTGYFAHRSSGMRRCTSHRKASFQDQQNRHLAGLIASNSSTYPISTPRHIVGSLLQSHTLPCGSLCLRLKWASFSRSIKRPFFSCYEAPRAPRSLSPAAPLRRPPGRPRSRSGAARPSVGRAPPASSHYYFLLLSLGHARRGSSSRPTLGHALRLRGGVLRRVKASILPWAGAA